MAKKILPEVWVFWSWAQRTFSRQAEMEMSFLRQDFHDFGDASQTGSTDLWFKRWICEGYSLRQRSCVGENKGRALVDRGDYRSNIYFFRFTRHFSV
jgi:hypothetical protein